MLTCGKFLTFKPENVFENFDSRLEIKMLHTKYVSYIDKTIDFNVIQFDISFIASVK